MDDFCDQIEMDWMANRFEIDYDDVEEHRKTSDDDYWIYAKREVGKYPDSKYSGKWLIFGASPEIDKIWKKIVKLTRLGKLGNDAKISTTGRGPKGERVICVYTYDWRDQKDVMKIRAVLRKAGVTKKIPYKSDADTMAGKCVSRGHKNISKYFQ